jgi:predicted O-methyltransferase YrrM
MIGLRDVAVLGIAAAKEGPLTARYRYQNLRWLYDFAQREKPLTILETGVKRGASSAAFLAAIRSTGGQGWLFSIDLPHQGPWTDKGGRVDRAFLDGKETPRDLVPESLRSRWVLRLGDATTLLPEVLYDLKRVSAPIDLFYHDSDHSHDHQMFEYETVWPYLRPGGVLISDDIDKSSAFQEFCAKVGQPPNFWRKRGWVRKLIAVTGAA